MDAVVFVIAPISCLLGWATTALPGWYDNGFTRNTYGYDSRGNLIYDGQTATGVAASSTPDVEYIYDAEGRLINGQMEAPVQFGHKLLNQLLLNGMGCIKHGGYYRNYEYARLAYVL